MRGFNKMVAGCAAVAGYHSTANVEATNKYIDDKVNTEMANLAAAVEAAMDDCAFDDGGVTTQKSTNDTAANATVRLTSSAHQDAVLDALKAISDHL